MKPGDGADANQARVHLVCGLHFHAHLGLTRRLWVRSKPRVTKAMDTTVGTELVISSIFNLNREKIFLCSAQWSRSGQGRAGQVRSGLVWSGQVRAGQGRAGQGRAGQGRAGQGRAGQGRAGQIFPSRPCLFPT